VAVRLILSRQSTCTRTKVDNIRWAACDSDIRDWHPSPVLELTAFFEGRLSFGGVGTLARLLGDSDLLRINGC